MMNKYIRKLFGIMFQSQQTRQIVRNQLQHSPTSPEEWRQHWQSQGQPWRTEPEIDEQRQEELAQRRSIVPNIEQGIYPFRGVKLTRADVEWLLATHENGRGPVDWSDESQRKRKGLDLRGADLRGMNLAHLPLACLVGGLNHDERLLTYREQRAWAAIHLEGVSLRHSHLEGAFLGRARLENANLEGVHLQKADLGGAHLEGASLRKSSLDGAYLKRAFFDSSTNINYASLGSQKWGVAIMTDMNWGGANLALTKWSQIEMLGDEQRARQKRTHDGRVKSYATRQTEYEAAVRANRQLAVALQAQGLNEDAARFAYRAQILQRKVLWKQRDIGKWLFSMLLALVAGYGYRMWRILVAYLLIVLLCAVAYFVLGMYYEPHLSLLDAVLTSITAFHGRVFSEPFLRPGEPQLWVTAFEAIAGLVIEGVFIAMLTQKFFGK